MLVSFLFSYLLNKKCSHENCSNNSIDNFSYCFLHKHKINNEELLKKIPGCKYVINNTSYCNKTIDIKSDTSIYSKNKYCKMHKCFYDDCINVKTFKDRCAYHNSLICHECLSYISRGTICESCMKKQMINDVYDEFCVEIE